MPRKYIVCKDPIDKLNVLGEMNWDCLQFQNEEHTAVEAVFFTKPITIPMKSPLMEFAYKAATHYANVNEDCRDKLRRAEFVIAQKYNKEKGKVEYKVDKRSAGLRRWRVEFDFNDGNTPDLYMSFGPYDVPFPALMLKEIIDTYVPKEDMEKAIEAGVFVEVEAKEPPKGKEAVYNA